MRYNFEEAIEGKKWRFIEVVYSASCTRGVHKTLTISFFHDVVFKRRKNKVLRSFKGITVIRCTV